MKLLFMGVINHEKTTATLARALSEIAEMLPQVHLSSALYPTTTMGTAVARLYANIMEFLIRARDWYEEGKMKHMIHSLTRPVELCYGGLLEDISRCTSQIKNLSVSGQQAEIRDMHAEIDERLGYINTGFSQQLDQMNTAVREIELAMTLQSAAMLDTNSRLTDIRFSQIMLSIQELPIWDPEKTYEYHRSLRNRPSHNTNRTLPPRFWNSPKIRDWFSSKASRILIVAGTFQSRFSLRNLCVDVIDQLRASHNPVLFALKVAAPEQQQQTSDGLSQEKITSTHVLKYLVRQALRETGIIQTEKSMSLNCARVHSAKGPDDWFQNLEAALSAFGEQVCLVIDLETLQETDHPTARGGAFSWLVAFLAFFEKLSQRGLATRVKVLLLTYGSEIPFQLTSHERDKYTISGRTETLTIRQQKLKRHVPRQPLLLIR
ncbi:hypothetical protein F5Y03DRAFT_336064 [Xylaria venustula]|nr:hypothetical protein F5Y03DRAFT_336064 [Xylaria venustula]